MITTISIGLYGLSVFFAAGMGVTSVKFKNGDEWRGEAALGITLTALPFLFAAILQVLA